MARSQTVEDGAPRWSSFNTLHRDAEGREFVRSEYLVRSADNPRAAYAARLVLRHYQATDDTTVALQALRVVQ
ncbi:MAG: hypothetical protein AB7O67_16485 [Vicinamibacterales bacterium]